MQFIEVNIELKKTVPYNEILIALLNDIKFNSYYENDNGLKAYIEESNFDLDLVIILTCLSKIILVCGRKKTPSGKDELSLFTFKLIFLQSNS